jgi:hypothetical protein
MLPFVLFRINGRDQQILIIAGKLQRVIDITQGDPLTVVIRISGIRILICSPGTLPPPPPGTLSSPVCLTRLPTPEAPPFCGARK